jgi:hypothetical protein
VGVTNIMRKLRVVAIETSGLNGWNDLAVTNTACGEDDTAAARTPALSLITRALCRWRATSAEDIG